MKSKRTKSKKKDTPDELRQFIDKLRDKQFELRCEKAMKTIQTSNRKEFLKRIKVDYKSFIFKEKNYYSRFFDIVSGICQNPPSIPNATHQSTKMQDIEINDEVHLKSLNYFISKLLENDGSKFMKNIENPDFINTLSFSLFPSISTFFHVNFLPEKPKKKISKSDNSMNYQIHNYNNIFLWLNNKIAENPPNKIAYQNAFDYLMRPMFFSPLFISFCSRFFQPILSNLQNSEANKENLQTYPMSNFLISQFQVQFELSTHLVPPFIALNLRLSDDPIRTLAKGFFEIALKTAEVAQYCGLFHYSRPPSDQILGILQKHLVNDQSSDNKVLQFLVDNFKKFGDIIENQMESTKKTQEFNVLTCSCQEKKVRVEINGHFDIIEDPKARFGLALQMKNYYFEKNLFLKQNKSLFRKVLFNTHDFELLDYIYDDDKKGKFHFSDNESSYKWINFGFSENANDDEEEEEKNDDSGSISISSTMVNNADTIAPNIRHILQNSDPIPQFSKIPEDMTVESFFEDYLVKKGTIASLPKRKEDKKIIFDFSKKPMNEIIQALDNTTLDQTSEIELLTIATSVKKKIDSINNLLFISNISIDLINNLVRLNKKQDYLQKIKSKTNKQYIKNPSQLYEDLLDNIQTLHKIVPKSNNLVLMKMIDFDEENKRPLFSLSTKRVYRPFAFDFLAANSFAHSVDDSFKNILSSNRQKILDLHLQSSFPTEDVSQSKFKKHSFLIEKIKNIRKCRNEIILDCRDAFSDPSVFRKVDLFNNVIGAVKRWVSEDMPNSIDDIGGDEMPGLLISVIYMAEPSQIASTTLMLQRIFFKFNHICFEDKVTNVITFASSAISDLINIIENDEDLKSRWVGILKDFKKFDDDIKNFVQDQKDA